MNKYEQCISSFTVALAVYEAIQLQDMSVVFSHLESITLMQLLTILLYQLHCATTLSLSL